MKVQKLLFFIIPILFLACGGNNPQEQKEFLTGYWQIEKVDSPFAEDKNYQINERVDYIEITRDSGFRAKVVPRLDGTIITNQDRELITLETVDDSLRLRYKTNYDEWTETVLLADEENLKVKNDRGMVYTYARYEPIDLAADGLLPDKEE